MPLVTNTTRNAQTVASAAPLAPIRGINTRFNTKFVTAPLIAVTSDIRLFFFAIYTEARKLTIHE